MPKRVEDIRPPRAALAAGLERGLHQEVEREAEILPFSYDQRQRMWDVLSGQLGGRWPDDQAERRRIFNDELREISIVIKEQFGHSGWANASPDERDMMLGAILKSRYGRSATKPETQPQPKPKGQWVRENQEFLAELPSAEAERAYTKYVERVKAGRIKP